MRLHDKLSHAIGPKYNRLLCDQCGRSQVISQKQMADYLAHGWPKCCAQTMKLTSDSND